MMHGGEVLEREQLLHSHGPRRADPREIVANEIDDHQVLGSILRALGERTAERGVVFGSYASRSRTLDGPRFNVSVRTDAQKALGRRAQDEGVGKVEIRGKRRSVLCAESAVQRPGGLLERRFESLRQIGLEDVAGEDVVAYAVHRVQISLVRKRRAEPDARIGSIDGIRRSHSGTRCSVLAARYSA